MYAIGQVKHLSSASISSGSKEHTIDSFQSMRLQITLYWLDPLFLLGHIQIGLSSFKNNPELFLVKQEISVLQCSPDVIGRRKRGVRYITTHICIFC